MALVSGTAPRSAAHQVLRGIGFTVALNFGLLVLLGLAPVLWAGGTAMGSASMPVSRRAYSVAVVTLLAVTVLVVRRSLRRWQGRPRWLMPAAWLVLVAALVPALAIPAPADDFASKVCIPVADAWGPVVTASASDLAYAQSVDATALPPLTHDHARNRANFKAYWAAQSVKRQKAPYVRAGRYGTWTVLGGACTPRSRTALGWSAAGLGLGAGALSLAVRRRRGADVFTDRDR